MKCDLKFCLLNFLGHPKQVETKEPQLYWKPSALKDGESEEFGYSVATRPAGAAVTGWQYASENLVDGELRFAGMSSLALILGSLLTWHETDWSKPDRPKIDVLLLNHDAS